MIEMFVLNNIYSLKKNHEQHANGYTGHLYKGQ